MSRDSSEGEGGAKGRSIVFVHGFISSEKCWRPFLDLLQSDPDIKSEFELECFGYPTRVLSLDPRKRLPRLKEVASHLHGTLDSPRFVGRELTLVGHSQGGLIILRYLVDMLLKGRGRALSPVRQVVLFATPSRGSTFLSLPRRIMSHFFFNPQERSLRVLDPDIDDLMREVRQRIVSSENAVDDEWPVPVHSFWGQEDKIVAEASARGPFDSVQALPGHHSSIIAPRDRSDPRYSEFKEVLLEPGGHTKVFEVESYETTIKVEPLGTVTSKKVLSGGRRRTVRTDNLGHILRRVRFSRTNRCRSLFEIRYGTRSDGYIEGQTSSENEAKPAEIQRYEDYGTEFVYKFTPEPGKTFSLNVDVWKGFDAGERDVHFHLGRQSYLKRLRYELDLSAYSTVGYDVVKPPTLYLHPEDLGHSEMCSRRSVGEPQEPVQVDGGTWRWEMANRRHGVIDIVWDVAKSGDEPTNG